MPETPKEKGKDKKRKLQKNTEDELLSNKNEHERSYYYDDACNYEVYKPEDDHNEDSE